MSYDGRLQFASGDGDLAAVARCLTEKHADPNQVGLYGSTPLLQASLNGHLGVADLLIRNGARVDQRDNADLTPLHCAATNGHGKVVELLISSGADVNLVRRGCASTPLLSASTAGHLAVVEVLLKSGAMVDLANAAGETPLARASCGFVDVTGMLIKSGAEVDRADILGCTPLRRATVCGSWHTMVLLLENGADPNRADTDGHTPLCSSSSDRVAELLLTFGAQPPADRWRDTAAIAQWRAGCHELQLRSAAVETEFPRHLRCHVPELVRLVRQFIHLTPPRQ